MVTMEPDEMEAVRRQLDLHRMVLENAQKEIELLTELGTLDDTYCEALSEHIKRSSSLLSRYGRRVFVVDRARALGHLVEDAEMARSLDEHVRRGYTRICREAPPTARVYQFNVFTKVPYYSEDECEDFVDDLIRSFFRP